MRWLLHEAVLKERLEEMRAVVAARGDESVVLSGRRPKLPEADGVPTFGLVTVQVAHLIYAQGRLSPGVFWGPTAFNQSAWFPWQGGRALNNDAVWVPWGEFVRRGADAWRPFAVDGRVFVRPDSGQKVFTGQTLALADFDRDVHALDVSSGVVAETLVMVCRPKPIDGDLEWRFWIGQRGVIASTPYSWEDDVERVPAPPAVCAMAEGIARECAVDPSPAPDRVFVADFCLSDGVPRLVELNSASSSGLYGADLAAVADGIAAAVRDEAA
jgi:hypothetical protein